MAKLQDVNFLETWNEERVDGRYSFKVNKNNYAVLKMPANLTTGYKWQIRPEKESNCLSNMSYTYRSKANPRKMAGVGGTAIFKWKVKGETGCKQTVTLAYS